MRISTEKEIIISDKRSFLGKNDMFVLIEASKLSLNDMFMDYNPVTTEGKELKTMLQKVISEGLNDFYRPKIDPSFNQNGDITYAFGQMPAVGRNFKWWQEAALRFMPQMGSRLGTKNEYIAFLGVLIKELSEKGFSIPEAWHAVCGASGKIGHYWDSRNTKHELETTGSRQVCRYYDLANTYKLLAGDNDNGIHWIASGYFEDFSFYNMLARVRSSYYIDSDSMYLVGWIVLTK